MFSLRASRLRKPMLLLGVSIAAVLLAVLAGSIGLHRENVFIPPGDAFEQRLENYTRTEDIAAIAREAGQARTANERTQALSVLRREIAHRAYKQLAVCKAAGANEHRRPIQAIVWRPEDGDYDATDLAGPIEVRNFYAPFSVILVSAAKDTGKSVPYSACYKCGEGARVEIKSRDVCEIRFEGLDTEGKPIAYHHVENGDVPTTVSESGVYDPLEDVYDWIYCGGMLRAAREGNLSIMEAELSVDPSFVSSVGGGHESPLEIAIHFEKQAAVAFLLSHGADANVRGPSGKTPLALASSQMPLALASRSDFGNLALVGMLIAKGAEVNARDDDGDTPLHLASFMCNRMIVEKLIGMGADVNALNRKGQTPSRRLLDAQTSGDTEHFCNDTLAVLHGSGGHD